MRIRSATLVAAALTSWLACPAQADAGTPLLGGGSVATVRTGHGHHYHGFHRPYFGGGYSYYRHGYGWGRSYSYYRPFSSFSFSFGFYPRAYYGNYCYPNYAYYYPRYSYWQDSYAPCFYSSPRVYHYYDSRVVPPIGQGAMTAPASAALGYRAPLTNHSQETYRYDGDPSRPVPLPTKETVPLRDAPPTVQLVSLPGRGGAVTPETKAAEFAPNSKSSPYPAYGDPATPRKVTRGSL